MESNLILEKYLSFSLCLWGLLCLYLIFCVSKFIVKHYEHETDLIGTVFFKKHATFSRHLPNLFSSGIYASHLLMCLWGWKVFRNKTAFRDIDDPNRIIGHFSKKELNRVKAIVIVGVLVILHAIGLDLLG
jgi:hypothetical protein